MFKGQTILISRSEYPKKKSGKCLPLTMTELTPTITQQPQEMKAPPLANIPQQYQG